MGCLSSKEKYKVSHEQEKVSGTLKRKQQQQIYSETQPRVYPGYPEKVFNQDDKNKKLAVKQTIADSEINSHNSQIPSDGFSSRNQFDRASQLRRSKKKRRKTNESLGSEPADNTNKQSPGQSNFNSKNDTRRVINDETTTHYQLEGTTQSIDVNKSYSLSYSTSMSNKIVNEGVSDVSVSVNNKTPKTAHEIVNQEAKHLAEMTNVGDTTFGSMNRSRAEYSSSYGNLI